MQLWKTLSRRTILDHSKYLRVEVHTIQLPNGQIIENWPWVISPDYVNVTAVTQHGHILCFRQTKYSIEGTGLAPVGGYMEPGEDPLETAKRELLEETGYTSDNWLALGRYPVDGNRGAGVAYPFLARNARQVAKINADDLEEQHLLQLTRQQVEEALDAGEFKSLPWAAAVALALRHL